MILRLLIATFLLPLAVSPAFAKEKIFHGTGDGGGGNLCQGQPIEHFRFYPDKSAAFQKLLREKMEAQIDDSNIALASMLWVIYEKPWYLLPCELKSLDNARVGIPGETEQGYVQTQNEVYVNKTYYTGNKKLKAAEILAFQAEMLVHEALMGIKYLKTAPLASQCTAISYYPGTNPTESPTYQECMKEAWRWKSLPSTIPDAKAHADVRTATQKMLELFAKFPEYQASSSPQYPTYRFDIEDIFRAGNFGFGFYGFEDDRALRSIPPAEFQAQVEQSQMLGLFPKKAKAHNFFAPNEDRKVSCRVEFRFDTAKEEIWVKASDGRGKLRELLLRTENSYDADITADAPRGIVTLTPPISKTPAKLGDREAWVDISFGWNSISGIRIYERIVTDHGGWLAPEEGPGTAVYECLSNK